MKNENTADKSFEIIDTIYQAIVLGQGRIRFEGGDYVDDEPAFDIELKDGSKYTVSVKKFVG